MTREEYILELVADDVGYHAKALEVAAENPDVPAHEFIIDHTEKLIFAQETLKYLEGRLYAETR
jgi:hypothetical protein